MPSIAQEATRGNDGHPPVQSSYTKEAAHINTTPSDDRPSSTEDSLTKDPADTHATPSHHPRHPSLHTFPTDSHGYTPPPKLPWTTSTLVGLKAFWKWFLTPAGFLITLYGLNVVAWGGMLFLLLLNAAPAMCKLRQPDGTLIRACDDLYSPRRIWIEIDSQILNALFCVTGFGTIPWRFRDLYFSLQYRGIFAKTPDTRMAGLRRLAGINRSWFRLPGSDLLDSQTAYPLNDERNPALPVPLSKTPDAPPTGVRAPPTAIWKLDFVIWCNVWNTFLQACLCGFMWGMNRCVSRLLPSLPVS